MILNEQKVVWIDLDGTIYRGDELIDGALEFITYLQKRHITFYFITNNATRTHKQNANKLNSMGFQGIQEKQFFTSAMATCSYIKRLALGKRIHCIGERGLLEAIEENGLIIDEDHPDIVIVGLDRQANYETYCKAFVALQQGAKLIATNDDRALPQKGNYMIGNGAIVNMFAYASEQPPLIIGKPYRSMMEEALRYAKVKKEDCVMIGDNVDTDIRFGIEQEIDTIFVASGVHTKEDLKRKRLTPSASIENLKELII